jgi:hypothetical protein
MACRKCVTWRAAVRHAGCDVSPWPPALQPQLRVPRHRGLYQGYAHVVLVKQILSLLKKSKLCTATAEMYRIAV